MRKLKVKWTPDLGQDLDAMTTKGSFVYDEELYNYIIGKFGSVDNFKKSNEFIKLKTDFEIEKLEDMNIEKNTTIVDTELLTRIAADLEKEMKRSDNEMAIADLKTQIAGLKILKKELDDFRTIKAILNVN